ncbi:hypothetical protein Pla163_08120 [Planctomycetes bacterium Pla163]|uniref:Uncharacterized protein n=1 Tax=Rohdeia mirabilis TaxID=2528008 RepID=A0A518CWV1_9BACT|nr:hypothetical protein Pla163_08120 [Planctomycetes bacterium Pla163]
MGSGRFSGGTKRAHRPVMGDRRRTGKRTSEVPRGTGRRIQGRASGPFGVGKVPDRSGFGGGRSGRGTTGPAVALRRAGRSSERASIREPLRTRAVEGPSAPSRTRTVSRLRATARADRGAAVEPVTTSGASRSVEAFRRSARDAPPGSAAPTRPSGRALGRESVEEARREGAAVRGEAGTKEVRAPREWIAQLVVRFARSRRSGAPNGMRCVAQATRPLFDEYRALESWKRPDAAVRPLGAVSVRSRSGRRWTGSGH